MRISEFELLNPLVPLQRYWCAREGRINFDDQGFVTDPEGFFGSSLNPDLKDFSEIESTRCLVLLGEAGIGKSSAIELLRPTIESKLNTSSDRVAFHDLSQYGDESRFVSEVFQCDEFKDWSKSSSDLHLILDAFDEGHNLIPTLPQIVRNQIAGLPASCLQRLFLRIFCRTGSWASSIEPDLNRHFGDDQVSILEMVPLRRVDVERMAEAWGVDKSTFIKEVIDSSASPFAIKPLTLQFLLGSFLENRTLPSELAELYAAGCLRLCHEPSRREESRIAGQLSSTQRLEVCGWISAALLMSNKAALSMDPGAGDEHLNIDDLLIEGSVPGLPNLNLTRGLIKECIQTGLFTSRGVGLFGTAHLAYAEYLAADYLKKMSNRKIILSLLRHPDDPRLRVAPQLEGIASWLAGMIEPVFEHILKTDPLLLLRGDLGRVDAGLKERLFDKIIDTLETDDTIIPYAFDNRELKQLNYNGIEVRLRDLIVNCDEGQKCREFAIRAAGACQLQVVAPTLREIAASADEPHRLRLSSVLALSRMNAQDEIASLREVLHQDLDDPDDELKGALLRTLWPDHLKLEELLGLLTVPKRKYLIGFYSMFLRRLFSEGLTRDDLPAALTWVASQPADHRGTSPFVEPVHRILRYAWNAAEYPDIRSGLAEALVQRLKRHEHELCPGEDGETTEIELPAEHRRTVMETMIPLMVRESIEPYALVISHPPIVIDADLPWLLSLLDRIEAQPEFEFVCKLIEFTVRPRSMELLDVVFPYIHRFPVLAEHLRPHIGPIELNSALAQNWRHSHDLEKQWAAERAKRNSHSRNVLEDTRRILKVISDGELDKWWELTQLMIDPTVQTLEENWRQPDMRELAVWNQLNSEDHEAIQAAAKSYVLERDDDTDQWLGKRRVYFPSIAGYKALYLLYSEDRLFVESLTAERWDAWAPITVAYPTDSSTGDDETRRALVSLAYKNASASALQILRQSILLENDDSGLMLTAEVFADCVDEQIESLFLELIRERRINSKSAKSLLSILSRSRSQTAFEFLRESLILSDDPSEEEYGLAANAAAVLAAHQTDADWDTIWSAVQSDIRAGQRIVCRLASDNEMLRSTIPPKLTEGQLADLYLNLLEWYPPEEDSNIEEFHQYTPREQVAEFRNAIFQELRTRDTEAACQQLTKIAQMNSHRPWLSRAAEDALKRKLARASHAVMPTELAQLLRDDSKRLVRSGDELMELVLESLEEIQRRLQGHVPDVQFLWDGTKRSTPSPKEEVAVSDYVCNRLDEHLRERGVVLNREVQVHRRGKTDIHVDAVAQTEARAIHDRVTLIIEVKGCWNDDLDTAMKLQLVDNYMIGSECRHGVYLVGWFNCEAWTDSRHKTRAAMEIDEIREQFRIQAESLSKAGMRIAPYVLDARLQQPAS